MKYTGHVAIGQYEFIEVVGETQEEVSEACRAIQREWKAGDGLTEAEMDTAIQQQLEGKGVLGTLLERMNLEQSGHYQRNKRAISRINYKITKLDK